MKRNAINGSRRRFKIQLRKTWSELTDADLEAICHNGDDLVDTVQHRANCLRHEVTKAPIRRLLFEVSLLANVCRRQPVSTFTMNRKPL